MEIKGITKDIMVNGIKSLRTICLRDCDDLIPNVRFLQEESHGFCYIHCLVPTPETDARMAQSRSGHVHELAENSTIPLLYTTRQTDGSPVTDADGVLDLGDEPGNKRTPIID
jgi:hypothetical protein